AGGTRPRKGKNSWPSGPIAARSSERVGSLTTSIATSMPGRSRSSATRAAAGSSGGGAGGGRGGGGGKVEPGRMGGSDVSPGSASPPNVTQPARTSPSAAATP